jgi:putative oxidoreductase
MEIIRKNSLDIGLLFLRTGLGLSYIIFHGAPKLLGGTERLEKVGSALSYFGLDFFPVFWGLMAALAEFIGGILIMLGIFFRPALSLMIITMFVAAAQLLARGEGIFKAAYPIEMSIALIALFIMGPGRYAVKDFLKRGK